MKQLTIPEKLVRVLEKPKRFKIILGGRGSAKSRTLIIIALLKVMQNGWKFCCLREYQNSINDSMLSEIESVIQHFEIPGFTVQKNVVYYHDRVAFTFRGLARNVESIKGMSDYDCFLIDEAATISEKSIDIIGPTLRKDGSELWFAANPLSSADPFSKTYINPYDPMTQDGSYEDDDVLFIRINYVDNPFFPKALEQQRLNDKKRMSTALYNWVWLGAFNDSVDDSIITVDMFNACIDAHKNMGWKPSGATIVAHDPSDLGNDSKGIAIRQGNVITLAQEKVDGDVKAGCTWSTDIAKQYKGDYYLIDSDGLGAGLSFQVETEFKGIKIDVIQFKGSRMAEDPDKIYNNSVAKEAKTNRETFKNRRAQYYFRLRDLMYNTYNAITNNEYTDPKDMISFDSEGIEDIDQLRSEICRIPQKLNNDGYLQIMPKNEMKSKYGIESPNIADSVMMTMYEPKPQDDSWDQPLTYTDVGVV